ncbi:hypothetical protein [Brevundimonas sp.]|uniref:hypothetical protein n=1 Tax=Brevundimonas sp. TaxID=1871086 RepID=UPI0035B3A43E
MIRAAALAALAIALGAPGPAGACIRPMDTPGERMVEGRWTTVATATVVEVESRSPERPNRAFTAAFETTRQVEGWPQTGRYRLWHEEHTECPVALPLPVEGEVWVLYFQGRSEAGGLVHSAWPLSWAQRLDPRFGGRADADVRDLERSTGGHA